MNDSKSYMNLKVFLSLPDIAYQNIEHFLTAGLVTEHQLSGDVPGKLFVKQPEDKVPRWINFVNSGIEGALDLTNRSSSAVLLVECSGRVLAYTFGYGRFMLDHSLFAQDFGIKTALNTLKSDSLRSVELFTVDRSAVQKKTQAVRDSSVDVFGIDVSKDILRAVTGSPLESTGFLNVSGGDSVYSFSKVIDFNDLPSISQSLIDYYEAESYQASFAWVDNIRRVKSDNKKSELDEVLRAQIEQKNNLNLSLTIPEIISWDEVAGFSYTRTKTIVNPTLNVSDYFSGLADEYLSLSALKAHKVFVHKEGSDEISYSLYKSVYFEVEDGGKCYVLFSGDWFEVDNDFVVQLNRKLDNVDISALDFPSVHVWTQGDKDKIEAEGAYNERAANSHSYHLLDKKLVKSRATTSAIELCDLLSDQKKLIHVKHKKGGSAGLSHLFAQGYVSAELILSDREFRKNARRKLQIVQAGLNRLLPLDRINSGEYEIVYLVLGEGSETVKSSLPFFSKINMVKAHENLTQKGFKVSIAGVSTEEVSPPETE
ncbi:DUF6119 family protein [Vreelandella venusta]|uniref:DUF6119 family protein n=1 Tax=Vreelandella venusta TaxID=44935 RepID=UPI003F678DFA